MGRIQIPEEFDQQHLLFQKILKQHDKLGKESPLYIHFDLKKFVNVAALAKEHHEKISKDTEGVMESRRNNLWYPVLKRLITIAEYLKAVHYQEPRILKKWGFEVVDVEPVKNVQFKEGNKSSYSERLSRLLDDYQ